MNNKRLAQCELCQSLMSAGSVTGVCSDCWEEDEKLFSKARSAMKFGERLLPEELSGKTGIEIRHIKRWATQGRFGSE